MSRARDRRPDGATRRRRRSATELLADDAGSTEAMEFVLVFPIMLTILTVIVQAALIWVALQVVQYASFNAARSAIAWVPVEAPAEGPYLAEPRNQVKPKAPGLAGRSRKLETIEQAAELSCLSITPALYPHEVFQQPWFSAPTAPVRIDRSPASLAARLLLARALTSVTLDKTHYGESDPVSVTVTHRLVLRVPIAARLLGEPFLGLANGALDQLGQLSSQAPADVKDMIDGKVSEAQGRLPWVKTLSATTTLLNQGRIREPQS